MMSPKRKKLGGCLKFFIFIAVAIFLIAAFIGVALTLYYINTLPTLEELTPSPIAQTSKVYALDGSLITEFHAGENREIISFNEMSPYIKDAIVAVEDKRFLEHQGVDYIRIIGAFIADLKAGEWVQGASTITQQYVKNIYFSPEKTFRRKINEALIAIQLERNYTKDKILEMYLNTINFGSGTYGIEKASEIYFGKNASELDLPQSALMAGLVRAPEIYSPFNDMEKAKLRRDLVLQLMYEQELIETGQYLNALAAPITLNEKSTTGPDQFSSRIAPYFVDYVKQNLYNQKFTDYDVFKGGLRIYTTLDINLQKKAENAVKKVFPEDIGPSYSLISIDPDNGYIYALIGGKDYSTSKFNIATQGKRQPGSVFKVLVLMESIMQNFSPKNTFNPNGPITIDMEEGPDWRVDNYGGQKFGSDKMSVVDGTIYSVNVVYAQLIMKVGAENVENLCNEMEIYDIGNNPAIAIGGLETGITPLDLSKVFSTLASGGIYRQPVCILKITDYQGNILYQYDPDKNESNHRVLEKPIAYYVTQILKKVIESGTGRGANIGRPAAGKTGTTDGPNDAWFAGYTPEMVTVVWMGYPESNKPMEPINGRVVVGGTYPADIWREFMSSALEDLPVSDFDIPDKKLIDIEVCSESNLLTTFWCPEETVEWHIFIEGEEPEDICNIHNKVEVPDVVGLNFEEAKQLFENLYFVVEEIYDFDETYNQDIIFKQNPEAGTTLESLNGEKLSITLYVSKGKKTFSMPELIGLNLSEAKQIIESLELVLDNIIYGFSNEQPIDKIFDQSPVPDSEVSKSTGVILYVSKGENPQVLIPDVIGMTKEEAIDILNNAGFNAISVIEGKTFEENSNEKDKVFAQIPVSGTLYNKSLEIIINISKGIKVPDVLNMTKGDAVTTLESLGFVVEISPNAAATGAVINQIPKADTYLNYGSKVTIEVKE
ncbi:MAG: PBP1A family penicillin-binding protein [Actinobacteria bacterium]|nr:PBP1A family penicillin-binding protein [Actinomycetota bacterium]